MADKTQQATRSNRAAAITARNFEPPDAVVDVMDGSMSPSVDPHGHTISTATAAYSAARRLPQRPWWYSQFNLMLAVFGLLVASAMLFVALAPAPEVPIATAKPSTLERLPDADAPWTQSQLGEARAKSQEILANLLDSKKSLEAKGVELWAAEGYAAALDLAAEGDEAYKQQKFSNAIIQYQAAAEKMNSLFDYLPRQIKQNLQAANVALMAGKVALANEKFRRVLQLEQGNLEALSGLDRSARLEQALVLAAAAKQDEAAFGESNDLASLLAAQTKLQEAKALADQYSPIAKSLQRVEATLVDTRFRRAMSGAYRDLFAKRYSAARRGFAAALKIKPGDDSATRARLQALASDQSASIANLISSAKKYEQQEEWASAQSNYQTVLQRDSNQVSAKLGVIRTGARLELDTEMVSVLSDSLALARIEQKKRASRVLEDARSVNNKGARLRDQIARLESALGQIETVLKVSFLSDSTTYVTLQKIGSKAIKLGQFKQRKMALKPGRYVVTGVRLGYQDVRQEIELLPASGELQSFTVQCSEVVGVSSLAEGAAP